MGRITRLMLGLSVVISVPLMAALTQTQADAEALVKQAVAFGKANGTYKLIKEVNSPETQFKKGSLYIFILDMEGVMLGHAANPKLVGSDMGERKDADNVRYIQEFIKMAETKGSGWVDYKFVNPETNKVEDKTSFIEKVNTVIIGCGVYKK